MQLLRSRNTKPNVIHQRTAIAYLHNPVSAKVGKIASNGVVVAEKRAASGVQMRS
jgi:hypothetical protein